MMRRRTGLMAAGAGLSWVATGAGLGRVATGAGLALLAQPTAAHGLMEVMARARGAVVAVGYYVPTGSPRFQFRGSGWVTGNGRQVVTNAHVLKDSHAAVAVGETVMVMVVPQVGAGGSGAPGSSNGSDDALGLKNRGGRSANAIEPRAATVLRRMPEADLALLQIEGPALPTLPIADRRAVEGQEVAMIGFPLGSVLGLAPVISRGMVSSVVPLALPAPTAQALNARSIARLRAGTFEMYQLDARAHPGNSGGPVLDTASGEVLGVINMALIRQVREGMPEEHTGISFAIPAAQVRELLAGP